MAHVPVATWTLELSPSEKKTYTLHHTTDLKITNVALGPVLADEKGRSTVILHINNDPIDSDSEESDESDPELSPPPPQKLVLTSLTPGKIESTIHDTVITRPALVTFEVIGKNTVHLSGYLYVPLNEFSDSESDAMGYGYDEEEDDEDLSEPEVNLQDVSSDVEVMVEDLEMMSDELQDDGHRFEEINEDFAELGAKRPRESDGEDAPVVANGTTSEKKLSKKEKKKLKAQKLAEASEQPPQKKVKGQDGRPVPVASSALPAQDTPAIEKKEGKKQKKEKGEGKADEGKTVKHPNGLIVKDSKIGNGAVVKQGSKIEARYIGKLSDGTVFDSNVNGSPLRVTVGAGGVIQGMEDGLLGMRERGERVLTIPPQLGYGKKRAGRIPPNSTLTFELKLLKVS